MIKEETKDQVTLTQRIIAGVTAAGAILLVFWAFTANISGIKPIGNPSGDDDANTYLLSYGEGLRIIFETIGRLQVTTILFCDVILAMTLRNWSEDRKCRNEQLGESVFAVFMELVKKEGEEKSGEKEVANVVDQTDHEQP